MPMMGYFLLITTMLLPIIILFYIFRNKNGIPTQWPFVGMLPALLKNLPRLNDFFIELLEKSCLSFSFNGPWFTSMNYMFCVDPTNIHHILSKKFGNYCKGSQLKENLEPLGNGILNTDGPIWQYHRNVAVSFVHHPNFHQFLLHVISKKIEHGLIPILEHASKHEIVIDIQEIFLRFMYDTMFIIMMDHDLKRLTIDLPSFPLLSAIALLEHGAIYRHVFPTFVWKFLRMFNLGYERKGKIACSMLDNLIYKCIDQKREQRKQKPSNNKVSADLLSLFMDKEDKNEAPISNDNDKFLKDSLMNVLLAGTESTSTALTWLFCELSKNPPILHKIKEELKHLKNTDESISINFNEINKLTYLHATICETMRLYPSVTFNPKSVVESDILPSGHPVKKNTLIILNTYAMGRIKSIWGEDCNEFKPERWITKKGKIKHEPSYKFSAFSSGPRSCLGKQTALTIIKIVAVNIILNYKLEAVEKYHVPDVAMILRMKRGFKVKVSRA